jgi:uncharacterized protein
MKKIVLALLLMFITCLSYGQTIPKSKGFVSDYENIFTPEQNSNLTNILTDYERKTSIEIAVLTVSDFESDIADFAQKTATEWGIGKKGIDNGLLIVISKNKKVLRTQTGYGLEGYLPDGWLKHTGDSIGIKYKDQYYDGTLELINLCKNKIGKEYSADTNKKLIEKNKSKKQNIISWMIQNVPWYVWVIIIVIWLIILIIDPSLALWILFLGLSSGKGGKGFGGGKFGGGGSNSSW